MGYSITQVKNRTNKDYEFNFDGQIHQVPAGETVAFVTEAALHGIRKSVISYNHITNTSIRALVKADSPEADEMVDARKPGSELIDRTDDPEAAKFKVQPFKNIIKNEQAISSSLDGE
jgi:hypothetical protein